MILIGTVGRCRSGKTTVGNAIAHVAHTMFNMKARQYEFGQVVLDYCISSGRLPQKTRAELAPHELHTLVLTGNRKREENPYFWVNAITSKIHTEQPDVAIVSGVRFPNEIDLVKGRTNTGVFVRDPIDSYVYRTAPGYLIRVRSLNPDGSEFISPDRNPNDPTETSMLTVPTDFTITAYRGETELLSDYAACIFNQIRRTR